MTSQVISTEKDNSVFLYHLRVDCKNSLKQSDCINDENWSVSEIEVHSYYSYHVFV